MECSTVINNNKPDCDFLSHNHISNKITNLTSTSCFNLQNVLQILYRFLQLSKAEKGFFKSVSKLYQSNYINSSNFKSCYAHNCDEQLFSILYYSDGEENDKPRSLNKFHGCTPVQRSRCDEITSVEPAVAECPSNAATRDRCVAQTVEHTEAIHVLNSATCTCPVSAEYAPPGEERACPIGDADLTTPVCDATFDKKSTESVNTGEGPWFLDNSCSSEVLVSELPDILLTTVVSAQNGDTFTDTVQSSPACKTFDEPTELQRVYAENVIPIRSPGFPEKEARDSVYESKDILPEMFEKEKVPGSFNAAAVDCGRPVRQEASSDLGNVIAATSDKAVILKTMCDEIIPVRKWENEIHCKSVFVEALWTNALSVPCMCTVNQHAENSVLSRSNDQNNDGENVETERRTVSVGARTGKSTLERRNGGLKRRIPLIRKETQRVAILRLEENQTDVEGATSRSDSASTVSLVVTTEKQGSRSCTMSLDKDETAQKTEWCKSDFRVCMEVSSISRKILDVLACNFEGQADLQFNQTHFEGPAASVVIHAYPILLQDLALGPRSELWRLCTFSTLRDLPVSPFRLARSGFYFAQNLDVIQCFSCGARKRHWDNSEQDVGRFHFPECNHAHSCDTTNAPIDKPAAVPHDSSVHVDIQHDGGDAQHGSVFLQTGQTVPSREPATAPAPLSDEWSGPAESRSSAAGKLSLPAPAEDPGLIARHREFAAQSAGTAVPVSSICPLIGDSGVAFSSSETVDGVNAASSAYMKQSPTVAYVTNTTSQVPTVTGSGRNHYEYYRYSVQATQHQSSAVQTHDQPNIGPASTRRPSSPPLREELGEEGRRVDAVLIQLDMTRAASRVNATARDRLASFVGWPTSSGQTPRTLALAGFYYLGSGDSVRCWYCGIILRNWRPFDDPWVTHVLFRFSCDFVIAVRGQDFVTQALVSRGHENASRSSSEFPPTSGFTDGFGAIQAAAILQDQVRSARSWEESGSTFGGQTGLSQPANNNPSNASYTSSDNANNTNSNNASNTNSNRAVSSSVGSNNNDISRSSDCIQDPVSERKASRQSPSGSAANSQQGTARDLEAVTASSSNVGKSESKTSHEEGIASRRENPTEVPGTDSGRVHNTCTGSKTASRKDGSGDSGREASAQRDARNSRGRDHGNDVGKDTSLPKGPDDQSNVGADTETSSHAGQFVTGTDSSSVAAPSRDNSPRRPDRAHGKLFSRWKRGKSKNHKKVIQQAASTDEDSSQPNRSSSQIHDTQSRGPGGTGSSGKRDVNVNKKEQEMKPSEEKENTTSHAENESGVNGQSGRSTSHMETALSESHTSSPQTGNIISRIEIPSNERQTSSPYTESRTSHLTNASFQRQAANHQTGRTTPVECVPRERITTGNLASQMLQVDSEAHDSVQGTSSKERTLSRGPDITSSATETRGTSQRQSSTVPEPSGCRPVSEPPLLHNMDPADREALYRRLQEENQRLRARRTCRICRRQTVDTIFLPCGHICSCETCASTVRECCLCFQRIRGTAHVYLE